MLSNKNSLSELLSPFIAPYPFAFPVAAGAAPVLASEVERPPAAPSAINHVLLSGLFAH